MSSTASTTVSAMAPALTMSVAPVPLITRWMTVRITRHGDPIDTMLLACSDCRSMADPPMAIAAAAVTANPAASATSGATSRGCRPSRRTRAMANPSPTRAAVTFTPNPRPTRIPASAARGQGGPRGPDEPMTMTAATPNTTAWVSTCAPATSTWSSSGLAAHSQAARSWRAG